MASGEAAVNSPRTGADRIDALLWLLLPVVVLFLLPIGFVSNDGLGHSLDFASGTWRVNPNHLLFEPLGAWWQNVWSRSDRAPVDALKLLSAIAGALAAALFRLGVAPRVAASRFAANHATAWLAFSSAFLRLWVSDEIHMIQMPFVVFVAWRALVCLERPTFRSNLALGAAVGLAALAYISNLGLGAALGIALSLWHQHRGEARVGLRNVVALALGTALLAGPVLLLAWFGTDSDVGFPDWLLHYGGGERSSRIALAYGLVQSWPGLVESTIRAVYGMAGALVDLGSVAAMVRDGTALSAVVVCSALAFLAAACAMLRGLWIALSAPSQPSNRGALLLAGAWTAAILGFGIFWNNSDDQFYFQMAPVFAVLVARIPLHRNGLSTLVLALSLAGLFWNLIDVVTQRVLYPRHERMALLERETAGACLVVYPGFDEADLLLKMARPAAPELLAITDLSTRWPAQEGLKVLRNRLDACLATGGRIVLIDLFDQPPRRNPWKFLQRLGYERTVVAQVLDTLPTAHASRRLGPFTVRSVPASAE